MEKKNQFKEDQKVFKIGMFVGTGLFVLGLFIGHVIVSVLEELCN